MRGDGAAKGFKEGRAQRTDFRVLPYIIKPPKPRAAASPPPRRAVGPPALHGQRWNLHRLTPPWYGLLLERLPAPIDPITPLGGLRSELEQLTLIRLHPVTIAVTFRAQARSR